MVLQILVVEDDTQDFELLAAALGAADDDIELHHVKTLQEGLSALDGHDAVLLDMGLPDSQGLDGLRAFRNHDAGLPVVVLTGNDDDEVALAAIRAGAQDYLTKSRSDARTVIRSLRFITARTRLETRAKSSGPTAQLHAIDQASSLEHLLTQINAHFEYGPVICISAIHGAQRVRNQAPSGELTIIDATGMPGATAPDVMVEPTKLELLAVHAERAAANHGSATVLVHSVEGLALYAGEEATTEFCQFLANRMRPLGIRTQFMISENHMGGAMARGIATYMDHVS